jgi:site-specific recombinase XerC
MAGCRALTDAEVQLVSRSFGGRYAARDRALFLVGVWTGYRISELLSLQIGDVWQHGQVLDVISVARRHMKGKTTGRSIGLHREAQAAVAAWLHAMAEPKTPDTALFRSREGVNRPLGRVQAWQILHDAFVTNQLPGRLDAQPPQNVCPAHLGEDPRPEGGATPPGARPQFNHRPLHRHVDR